MNGIGKITRTILCVAALASVMTLEAAPKVPTPTASQGTYAKYVKVTWKKVSGATGGYNVRRSTTSSFSDATLLKKCKSTTTSLLDTSAVAGKTYYYWVCPIAGKYYYYNESLYASGYRKATAWAGILGSDTLSYARYNKYFLAINGQLISSPSIKWSVSSPKKAYMGNWGWLLADKKVSTTVVVKATYNRKTYTKSVRIYPSGTYGKKSKGEVIHNWQFCSKVGHGWYDAAHSVGGGCPACRSSINL